MIIYDHPQGSAEWLASRAGVITASKFVEARKRLKSGPKKGGFTEAAEDYAFRVAVERISGAPLDEGFSTWAMKRGNELEPEARAWVEVKLGIFVDTAGFVTTDDEKFGASADGFIDKDGGLEIKCLVDPGRIRNVILSDDISEFMDQIQGGMWITGRKWWQFALFCPALEKVGLQLYTKRVERDDNYINEMELDLLEFERVVSKYEQTLRDRGMAEEFKEAA
jgi:hypothetical protein